eukprot:7718689-Pyramimonas_sp.AAC.1
MQDRVTSAARRPVEARACRFMRGQCDEKATVECVRFRPLQYAARPAKGVNSPAEGVNSPAEG